jgi:hypothetical protein
MTYLTRITLDIATTIRLGLRDTLSANMYETLVLWSLE